MCAIAGMIGYTPEKEVMDAMLKTMHRRGPDENGIYQNEDCTLLHSRLAVIDLTGGKQPMQLDWAGETFVLVYNGELYNTEEIRQDLQKKGHTFSGHSDTEVVLHAYVEYGQGCVEKFNGIFAFAIWEKKKRRLFLARDRIGVKPLFYKSHGNGLLFASEIKTILAFPTVKAELDREGAAQLLLLGPGRMPGSGVFRGIQEVEPGYCGYWEAGKLYLTQYWKLRDREHREDFSETVAHVRFLVEDAIRRQMVSDVPIGTFLSGGLDSSLITAICARNKAERGERLNTFSVDYVDQDKYFIPGKFQPNSDTAFIRIMQEALDTRHHWTVLSPEDLVNALEDATMARDLPGMADVDFSLLAFCKHIRSEVKVALSGECADEIFGGYPWYRDPAVRARAGFPWAQNTSQRVQLLHPDISINGAEFVMDVYEKTCRESDILPGNSPQEKRMKEMVNLNFRWFMQTLLDRKDRMSMFSSLEVRVPFCDYRIAEYLYAVPWEFKDYRGTEKGLLRCSMEGVVPREILWRKKSPYPKTFDPKYGQLVADRLCALMEESDAPLFSLVNRGTVEQLFASKPLWPWYGQLMGVPQTMAYLLQLDFWLRQYKVQLCW